MDPEPPAFWTTFVADNRAIMVRSVVGGHWSALRLDEASSSGRVRVWTAASEDGRPLVVEIELPTGDPWYFGTDGLEALSHLGLDSSDFPSPTIFPGNPQFPAYVWWGPVMGESGEQ